MSLLASTNWQPVVYALAAAIPGGIAAIVSWLNRQEIKTRDGRTLGETVADTNQKAAVAAERTTRIDEALAHETTPPAEGH